jgi:sphinganine-1-phosphate aldolase
MKAASYFNIKLVLVPVDPVTFRAKVGAMKRACNSNTIMVCIYLSLFSPIDA